MAFRDTKSMVALTSAVSSKTEDTICEVAEPLLRRLYPHIHKSIKMANALALEQSGSNADITRQLECYRRAVFTLRASGRIAWHNNAGEFLLNQGTLLLSHHGMLNSRHTKLSNWLDNIIKDSKQENSGYSVFPLLIDCSVNGRIIFHWHKLTQREIAGKFPATIWSDPVVGMLVVCGLDDLNNDDDVGLNLAKAFGATTAESKLAAAVFRGLTLYEYAELNELSRHTVRNQMRALLAKAGVRSQQEFVLLMLKLDSPFQ